MGLCGDGSMEVVEDDKTDRGGGGGGVGGGGGSSNFNLSFAVS